MGRLISTSLGLILFLSASNVLAEVGFKTHWDNLWRTPAQQGQRAFEQGDFKLAAQYYEDPMQIGSAYFRAAEFELAAAAFGRVSTAEGAFNQGTALVLQGQYAAAITAFDRALAARPDWVEAQQNSAIAQARLARLEPEQQQGGKATEIGADEVVFDLKNKNQGEHDEISTASGQGLSDKELRALWLNNSQTSPAVFLKAKFAIQLATPDIQPEQ